MSPSRRALRPTFGEDHEVVAAQARLVGQGGARDDRRSRSAPPSAPAAALGVAGAALHHQGPRDRLRRHQASSRRRCRDGRCPRRPPASPGRGWGLLSATRVGQRTSVSPGPRVIVRSPSGRWGLPSCKSVRRGPPGRRREQRGFSRSKEAPARTDSGAPSAATRDVAGLRRPGPGERRCGPHGRRRAPPRARPRPSGGQAVAEDEQARHLARLSRPRPRPRPSARSVSCGSPAGKAQARRCQRRLRRPRREPHRAAAMARGSAARPLPSHARRTRLCMSSARSPTLAETVREHHRRHLVAQPLDRGLCPAPPPAPPAPGSCPRPGQGGRGEHRWPARSA
jgi:hypothetical protein